MGQGVMTDYPTDGTPFGEHLIEWAIIAEEVEGESSRIHTVCELFVKDFGSWGPCYRVQLIAVDGKHPGERLDETDWMPSARDASKVWKHFTDHECPKDPEEIERDGKVAI
jgi:hypothetical protein